MFPSSTKDTNKFSCDAPNCPERIERNEDAPLTSSAEEINMKNVWNKINTETQMCATKTSSSEKIDSLDKTSEKSSQAYFDRNNPNISSCFNKCGPSNSSQTTQSESQMLSVMLKCPSKLFAKKFNASKPHCFATRKCNCKKFELTSSSSSASLASDSFPVKLNKKPKAECWQVNHEQFYSCSSDDSESEEYNLHRYSPQNKRRVFFELLQKVVHLIQAQVAPSSNPATSKAVVKGKQLQNKSTSITLLTPLVYSHHRYCCCRCPCGMADTRLPPYNIPYLQHCNLGVATAAARQIPEAFVCKETDINRTLSEANQTTAKEDQTPVKPSGLCSKIPICSCFCPAESQSNELDLSKSSLPPQYVTGDNKVHSDRSEMEDEYVDEELHPRYVDKILTEPSVLYGPTADSLMQYDDEEPVILEHIEYVDEEIRPFLAQVHEVDPCEVFEFHPYSFIQTADGEQIYPIVSKTTSIRSKKISAAQLGENKILDESLQIGMKKVAPVSSEAINETEEDTVPYILHSSTTSGRHIYNFLPEIDKPVVSKQLITCKESDEEDEEEEEQAYECYCIDSENYELCKEKISESRKRKARKICDQAAAGSPAEIKFFIDSLIMDLKAMKYARRKSQFEKNICKTKIGLCNRNSFPVTITDVTDLGASSLYVKWRIHDCFGVAGYEIYTDGYLTNRYYNSIHDSAVITQVDVTLPHKIALVAQACVGDGSFESICGTSGTKGKHKSSPCKTVVAKDLASHTPLWTPSIFLYDPITCRANAEVPPINYEQ